MYTGECALPDYTLYANYSGTYISGCHFTVSQIYSFDLCSHITVPGKMVGTLIGGFTGFEGNLGCLILGGGPNLNIEGSAAPLAPTPLPKLVNLTRRCKIASISTQKFGFTTSKFCQN